MLTDPEPMLPTRGYRVLCHDATLIDLEAEGMWPMGTQLKFTVTTLVIGLRVRWWCSGADGPTLTWLLRDDGAVGQPSALPVT
jgi:hypothetical protein